MIPLSKDFTVRFAGDLRIVGNIVQLCSTNKAEDEMSARRGILPTRG